MNRKDLDLKQLETAFILIGFLVILIGLPAAIWLFFQLFGSG